MCPLGAYKPQTLNLLRSAHFRKEEFMSFVTVDPESLSAAAASLQGLGHSVNAGMAFASAPTTGVAPPATDPVSGLTAALFGAYARSDAATPQTPAESLEAIHEAIVRDVLAGADFWGGFGSKACQQFITSLGHNFQVIYDHLQTRNAITENSDSETTGTDRRM